MEMRDLIKFVDKESKRLRIHYSISDEEKIILAQTVKVMEELGELCNEVSSHVSLQRKEKLDKFDEKKIQEEFADVIIIALLLAKSMNIDVEKGLEKKIKKINKRYEK